jgi:hypothetical protein
VGFQILERSSPISRVCPVVANPAFGNYNDTLIFTRVTYLFREENINEERRVHCFAGV